MHIVALPEGVVILTSNYGASGPLPLPGTGAGAGIVRVKKTGWWWYEVTTRITPLTMATVDSGGGDQFVAVTTFGAMYLLCLISIY